VRLSPPAFEWLPIAKPKWQYQPVTPYRDHSFDFVRSAAEKSFKPLIIQAFLVKCCAAQHIFPLAAVFSARLAKKQRCFPNGDEGRIKR
jgi:hypothetical protein